MEFRTAKSITKTEEVKIKRVVETIEYDLDFTQLYNCFFLLSLNVCSGSAFHIMFFLLHNMNRDNIVNINADLLKRFQDISIQLGKKPMGEQSFYRYLKELQKAKIMERMSKGQYFMNIYAMWKDDKTKRIEYITAENGETGQKFAFNPLQLLLPKEVPHIEDVHETITEEEVKEIHENNNNKRRPWNGYGKNSITK